MDSDKSLQSRLTAYSQSDFYPFHMPGHKRQPSAMWGLGDANPCSLDITEIDGFDNLHHPEGILRESMDWAASVYGAGRTYYLVNGSTCGILSAMSALSAPGGTVLITRNCHKSAYHGVILNRLESVYIYPQYVDKYAIQCGLNPDEVESILSNNRNIQLIMMVSPTYEGIVSDIGRISRIAHAHGVPLIVDEAHGAHFPFSDVFPDSALEQGADIVVQSLHKTLPSFTQTALLHVNAGTELVDVDRLEWFLQVYQSSSPSYLMMASIENCIRMMAGEGRARMERFTRRLGDIRDSLAAMGRLKLLSADELAGAAGRPAGELGICGMDDSRIVVALPASEGTDEGESLGKGMDLGRILRKEFHLEMEMCGYRHVTAIATLADTPEGLIRLRDAFLEIDRRMGQAGVGRARKTGSGIAGGGEAGRGAVRPAAKMPMWEAMAAPRERLLWRECVGRVCAEFVYLYPPGIPVLTPGEIVTGGMVRRLDRWKDMGMAIQGMGDRSLRRMEVVKGP